MDNDELLDIKQRIEDLSEDIKKIRSSPLLTEPGSKELAEQIKRLTAAIERLIHIFDIAQRDIIENYHGEHPSKKLERIEQQNKLIAQGLVELKEKIDSLSKDKQVLPPKPTLPEPTPTPQSLPSPTPPLPSTPPTPPSMNQFNPNPPLPNQQSLQEPLPEFPPIKEQKKKKFKLF